MTTDVPSPLVPKLRFPEFRITGDWKRDQIGNIASISKGKGVSKADIEKSGFTPCIRYAELYTHYGEVIREALSHTNVPPEDLVLSQAEDVIVPASGETLADIARAACVVPAGVALGGDLNILRSDLSGRFFSYLLNSPLRSKIARLAQGDTVAHLYPGQLSKVTISYPLPAEQQKIADCLGSLDDLIAADGRKLEALRQHKQGLMQQLFPQPGETVPRLRFPGFLNGSTWDELTIGGVCDLNAGDFIPASEITKQADEGSFPCYGGNGFRGYVKSFTHEGRYVLVGRQGALCGNVKLYAGKFHATEHALVAMPKPGVNTGWLFYALDVLKLNRFATGQAQPGLSVGVLSDVGISIPIGGDEQQKIADCLGSLNDLIAAEGWKLETLRQHKQGLLQQLFPNPEAV